MSKHISNSVNPFAQVVQAILRPGRLAPAPAPDAPAKVRPLAALFYGTLSSYAYGNKSTCYPSIQTLADDLAVSRRTISRLIKELVQAGWIKVQSRCAEMKSNIYTLLYRVQKLATPHDSITHTPSQKPHTLATDTAYKEHKEAYNQEDGEVSTDLMRIDITPMVPLPVETTCKQYGLYAPSNMGAKIKGIKGRSTLVIQMLPHLRPAFKAQYSHLLPALAKHGIKSIDFE